VVQVSLALIGKELTARFLRFLAAPINDAA